MRLATHIVTGFLASFNAYFFMKSLASLEDLIVASLLGLLGAAVNVLIDALGHERRGRVPRRSWTHSLVGILVLVLPIVYVANVVLGYVGLKVYRTVVVVSLFFSALTHLLLDAFTERGLPLLWPFSRRRFALAHLDYDNLPANLLAIIAYTLPLIKPLEQVIRWLELYAH